jgi:thiamine transport system substrate-binding protein
MKTAWFWTLLVAILIVGCTRPTQPVADEGSVEPRQLRVMTYSSFDIGEETIRAFEEAHNARVQFLDAGDTGQMVSQAILSKDDPQADVLYGVDNTFLSRALEADIFVPYEAEGLARIPDALRLDPAYRVTPVDYGDVCLNYDHDYFRAQEIPVPSALEDLTAAVYRGLLVVQNPASSSPGLAFMLATVAAMGEDGYLTYWQQLRENDVLVVDSWDTAYYGEFSGGAGSGGTRPIIVSYATSPAAEVYYSEEPLDVSPTAAIIAPGTCFRQVEFVGILRNGQNPDLAEAFVDYVLSDTFQNDIPLHMWVYPASDTATLPEVFENYAMAAIDPASMSVEIIEQNRQAWVDAWTDVVLR